MNKHDQLLRTLFRSKRKALNTARKQRKCSAFEMPDEMLTKWLVLERTAPGQTIITKDELIVSDEARWRGVVLRSLLIKRGKKRLVRWKYCLMPLQEAEMG